MIERQMKNEDVFEILSKSSIRIILCRSGNILWYRRYRRTCISLLKAILIKSPCIEVKFAGQNEASASI